MIFLDFLNTLENLQEGSRMDQEFVKLLAKDNDVAENFFDELVNFKDALRKKVRELGALIDVKEHQNVEQWFWREKTRLYDVLVHDIHVSEDLLILIDTNISPRGWEIDIFVRGVDGDRSKSSSDRSKLRDLLQRWEIPFKERQGPAPFVYASFDYSETLNRISPVLQDLIDKPATSQEREE